MGTDGTELSFGHLLRLHRRAASLSQAQLAERAGLSERGISDLERGKHRPLAKTLGMLASALALTREERAAFGAAGERLAAARPVSAADNDPSPPFLPVPATALIGREHHVAEACALLRRSNVRLVTLTGPGGVGKTRVAIAIASTLAPELAGGILWVDLTVISNPALIGTTIARAGTIPAQPETPSDESVRRWIGQREILLVLDNCEHVLSGIALVADLIATCPRLRVLATSRERLRLRGEREFPVAPLELPHETGDAGNVNTPAVRLFAARAADVQPDFALSPETIAPVVEICRRLDGLPLAIELAAGWIKVLPLHDLPQRLERRLALLMTGHRDAPARQQSLHAAIDWSYALLSADEQDLLQRLSVFVGGFTLPAAVAVFGKRSEVDVVAGIASLIDKSLVNMQRSTSGDHRYGLLETIREFAHERLVERGVDVAAHNAHAAHFAGFAQAADASLFGYWDDQWLPRLDTDLANLRAAMAWSTDQGDATTALTLTSGLFAYWVMRGLMSEARDWLSRALAIPGRAPSHLRVMSLRAAAGGALVQGDEAEARQLVDEGLSLSRESDDRLGIALFTNMLAELALIEGDPARAWTPSEESLAMLRSIEAPFWLGFALDGAGNIAERQGDLRTAEAMATEGLAVWDRLRHPWGRSRSLENLAWIAFARGDLHQATSLWQEVLAVDWEQNHLWNVLWRLDDLGMVAAAIGQWDRSARLLGAANRLRDEIGTPIPRSFLDEHERLVASIRAALGEDGYEQAEAAGRRLSNERAVAEAFAVDPALAPTQSPPPNSAGSIGLTRREAEVLRLLADGLSNQEIAAALSISSRTVPHHTKGIYDKLDVRSRTAAVAAARRLGLV